MKRFANIPIFIPELACPHRCVFCNQETISGNSNIPTPEESRKIIETYLSTLDPQKCRIHIAFFGGSFTGIPEQLQNDYLQVAKEYIDSGDVKGIRLSTRPDYISTEIVERLGSYSVQCIELGAQSLDEDVLRKTGRDHSVEDVENASAIIKNKNIELGLQMMLGLPGDTFEKSLYTANKIIELGAGNTRIYPCLVIKGTVLEKMYKYGSYTPLDLQTAVEWTSKILPLFEKNNITVLRTGLHPSEEFEDPDSLLAGPYHPSFKALVLSEIWAQKLTAIKENSQQLTIYTHPSAMNYAVGHKQSNKQELLKRFKTIKFKADKGLKTDELKYECG